MVWKHKSTGMEPALTQKELQKNEGVLEGHPVSAKPLKPSKKFVAQSSRLSGVKKTSPAGIKISRKKMSSTFSRGSDATPTSARALDFFDLGSFVSNGETTLLALPQKCPRKPSSLKTASELSAARGEFEFLLSLLLP
jgi:hypothetical protein